MRAREGGFALAETLVALAIVAVMLGLSFRTIGVNAQSARLIDDRAMASLVARSALDYAVATARGADGARRGESAGYVWDASVSGVDAARGRRESRLRRVSVVVRKAGATVPLARLSTVIFAP